MRAFVLTGLTIILAPLAACSVSSRLTTSGLGGSSSSSGPAHAVSESRVTVPELRGLTVEQAKAALRKAGFQRELMVDDRYYTCDTDFRPTYARFEVCGQKPRAGTELGSGSLVTVNYEHDEPDHGNIGFSGEWRRMPDVVGKRVDQAGPILAKAKIPLAEHFEIHDGDCAEGTICRTSPAAGERKVLSRKGRLFVGVPAAAAPPPSGNPPATPTKPDPDKDTYF